MAIICFPAPNRKPDPITEDRLHAIHQLEEALDAELEKLYFDYLHGARQEAVIYHLRMRRRPPRAIVSSDGRRTG